MLQECLLRTPKAAGALAPVGEDDVWVHCSHIQVVDQGALFSVGHVPQRLQLCLDPIPYLFVVDNILHRCLTLHCDCILQILIQLVYQGLSAASTNSSQDHWSSLLLASTAGKLYPCQCQLMRGCVQVKPMFKGTSSIVLPCFEGSHYGYTAAMPHKHAMQHLCTEHGACSAAA